MVTAALVGLGLAVLVGLLAVRANAASLNCSAVVYLKINYAGENFKMTLAPEGVTDKEVILDLDAIPKPTTYRNWDDALNSIRFWCNCTAESAANCTDDYAKMRFRVFAEPWWRKNGGGDFFDLNCTAAAGPAPSSCSSRLPVMPPKWASRASALALLYNLPNYQLPKKAPASTSPSPVPGPTPSPSLRAADPPSARPPSRRKPSPLPPPPKGKRAPSA